ncbi:MAG TPA: tetratricopeptide repeat protein [Casimicrobiaceae bacterium]|nr:tetratricopeptide repeat protein [Casimicrobiaceae bacterium]
MSSETPADAVTFLFTDIEGSTRLWERAPERMRPALARHNALAHAAIESNRGRIVKMTGDGVYAIFDDALDALGATIHMQQALADPALANGVDLRVRCGLHTGVADRADGDFFGTVVNRAARIMNAAHGGQILLSHAVAATVRERLPAGVALHDLGSVRLRDLASPERIYQLVHPQLRQTFPALRSLEATPNNLPQQITSFIGRERELAETKTLLANTRLLTLLGAGGLGKTRLSLQLAADVIDDFPDGVWFVELAPLADAQLVPQAVASVLGVKEAAGHQVIDALVEHVKDRKLSLILDNCEHLTHACAELAKKLLQAGSQVKLITSSREHLRVPGETTYPIPPLVVPDPCEKATLEAISQCEAVRIFIDRAIAAQPAFRLTPANASAVTEICYRLDGIPLALELAASRVRALSVETIAARLGDRFRLLTGGDRTALPRQQTLRASIDWSYDLLTDGERTLLRRLAIFSGSWTLEAAEAVTGFGELHEPDVLDLLAHLVDKSLTVSQPDGARYRLLETVRQYAHERLREASEEDDVRARHLAFYLALAEAAEPELLGVNEGAWCARLDLEQPNLLLAHASCEPAESGATAGLRFAFSLRNYWIDRGLLGLAHRLTLAALARPGASQRDLVRCRALAAAGSLEYFMGLYADGQEHSRESLSIAEEIGDKERIATAFTLLGHLTVGHDPAAARKHYEAALTLARELGDKRRLANILNGLGVLCIQQGDVDHAEPFYEEALRLDRERGEPDGVALGLVNLAVVSIHHGSSDRARELLLEALAIADEAGLKRSGLIALFNSIGLATLLGEWERAARLYGWTEAQREQMGLHREPSDDTYLTPCLVRVREALDPSAFHAAESAGRSLTYDEATSEARRWLEGLRGPTH